MKKKKPSKKSNDTTGSKIKAAEPKTAEPKTAEPKTIPVINSLVKAHKPLTATKKINDFGNYWDSETKLVFGKESHTVIGKQASTGDIVALSRLDIEICKEKGFKFIIPENILEENAAAGGVTTFNPDDDFEIVEELLEEEDEEELAADEEDLIERYEGGVGGEDANPQDGDEEVEEDVEEDGDEVELDEIEIDEEFEE